LINQGENGTFTLDTKLSGIEITVVGNGYIVGRVNRQSNQYQQAYEELQVFQSFDNLMGWLKKNLKDPNEWEGVISNGKEGN